MKTIMTHYTINCGWCGTEMVFPNVPGGVEPIYVPHTTPGGHTYHYATCSGACRIALAR